MSEPRFHAAAMSKGATNLHEQQTRQRQSEEALTREIGANLMTLAVLKDILNGDAVAGCTTC